MPKYHCVILNIKEKQSHFKWYPAIPIKNNNQHGGYMKKQLQPVLLNINRPWHIKLD
jgi:hypothetical protein